MIGYAFCGSFCTHKKSLEQIKILKSKGYEILPIMSENVYGTDTYFGSASNLKKEVEELTQNKIIHTNNFGSGFLLFSISENVIGNKRILENKIYVEKR